MEFSVQFRLAIVTTAIAMTISVLGLTATANASAAPMWTNCSSVATNFTLNTTGGDYASIGCTFMGSVWIDTSASNNNINWYGSILQVTGGFVQPTFGIGVIGPSAAVAPSIRPLQISVTEMTFDTNAVFLFTGALPPFSSLTISNNSFSIIAQAPPNNWWGPSGSWLFAISIGDPSLNMVLTGHLVLSVANNTVINSPSSTSQYSLAGIYLQAAIIGLYDASTIHMGGNLLLCTPNSVGPNNNATITAILWAFSSNANISLSQASVIDVSNNSVWNANAVAAVVTWQWETSVADSSSIELSGRSFILQNNNSISNAANIGPGPNQLDKQFGVYGVFWRWTGIMYFAVNISITLSEGSGIEMNRNKVSSFTIAQGTYWGDNAYAVYWLWSHRISTLFMSLTENSYLAFDGNAVNNTSLGQLGNAAAVSLLYQCNALYSCTGTVVVNHSHLTMDGNSVSNTTASQAFSVVWSATYSDFTLSITNESHMSMSNCTNENAPAASTIYFSGYEDLFAIQVSNKSRLVVKGNSLTASSGPFIRLSPLVISSDSLVSFQHNAAVVLGGYFIVFGDVDISTGGMLSIDHNVFGIYGQQNYVDIVRIDALSMSQGIFALENNTIQSDFVPQTLLLVASSNDEITYADNSTFLACGNCFSWDNSSCSNPAPYLKPAALASFVGYCGAIPIVPSDSHDGLKPGAIAGIAVGAVGGVALLVVGLVYFRRHKGASDGEYSNLNEQPTRPLQGTHA